MTSFRLLLRSLSHYWRTNLAVVLGVVAGTAVIGGALIVGDSVRGSLRQMTLDRLGDVDFALVSHRFFRQDLADELKGQDNFSLGASRSIPVNMWSLLRSPPGEFRFKDVAPALVLTGGVEYHPPQISDGETGVRKGRTLRAGQVSVWGVEDRLWKMTKHGDVPLPVGDELILNRRLADQLQESGGSRGKPIQPGDRVTLWVELPPTIPREALLGKRDETTREIEFTVKAILDEDSGLGRLSLMPNQQLPPNAFVSLETLQQNLELSKIEATPRNPVGRAARVNALFVSEDLIVDDGLLSHAAAFSLGAMTHQSLTADDVGMRVVANGRRDYLSLETEQQILDDALATAGEDAAKSLGLKTSPVFVYLANEMWKDGTPELYSRYSVVAGVNFADSPPFGPFEFLGQKPPALGEGKIESGGAGEIVLNEWLADDLEAKTGDTIRMKWHVVGSQGELPEIEREFLVKGVVRLTGAAEDRGLTPEVKGITDVETFSDWDAPFEMKKVTGRDDDYWEQHRATPKAFVTLKTAQLLWKSRYGSLTSLRVTPPAGKPLSEGAEVFTKAVLERLDPADIGMSFQAVKQQGLDAASGTTDFSGLFLGFSFFLILSATILIGLLFRLGIERRAANVGLLEAVGLSPRQVKWLFLGEGLLLVVAGGLLGTLAAVGYASLMVYGLKTWWVGAIGTRFLDVYITPKSLFAGFAGSVVVAFVAVAWGLRQLRGIPVRDLLAGATEAPLSVAAQSQRGRRAGGIAAVLAIVAALLLAGVLTRIIPDSEAFSGFSWPVVCFFLVGVLFLAAGLTALSAWLDSDRALAVRGGGLTGIARLGMRNASRQRQRSVMTVGLIASAAFVLVAVAAGHRDPIAEQPVRESGNGGFVLVAESSTPILFDLGTPKGRAELDLNPDLKSADAATKRDAALLDRMDAVPFRVKPGDDASCLNIYRTRLPTLLGVPPRMIQRGGFKFVGAKRDEPWTLLTDPLPNRNGKPVYPVFGDMNTLQYSLKKGVGSTIAVPEDEKPEYHLQVVGMLDSSVFQGVLLLSEENFLKVAPERAGSQYFLIGDRGASGYSPDETADLIELLESRLAPFGFDAERVSVRLAGFLAVQNTYLSTFQTLGGLGLLLGTLGLATVMLRNVLERRAELALLRAVGFRNSRLAWLVMGENAFLLLWGLCAGTAAALLAMLPHILSLGGDVPWGALGVILLAVAVVGMLAALIAVREAVRTPIVATLRGE